MNEPCTDIVVESRSDKPFKTVLNSTSESLELADV